MSGHNFGSQAADHARFTGQIADPGNAGSIALSPHNSQCTLAIKTTGAETRTLKDPVSAGITLTIFMDTDGGDCVITADTAVNEAGNTTITLDDPGEVLKLIGITIAGVPVWRVIGSNGATLS